MLRNIRCKASYFDRVDVDNSNKVFYIYNLARYHNRPHYCFGETHDIHATELVLARTLPLYKRIYVVPVDHVCDGISKFQDQVQPYITSLPFDLPMQVFALEDSTCMTDIVEAADIIFKQHSNEI
jgi:hypothetical protein